MAIVANTPGRTRTCDREIRNQFDGDVTAETNGNYDNDPSAPTSTATSRTKNEQPSDPDLQRVIDRWSDLPTAIKAGIVALVNAGVKP